MSEAKPFPWPQSVWEWELGQASEKQGLQEVKHKGLSFSRGFSAGGKSAWSWQWSPFSPPGDSLLAIEGNMEENRTKK